MTRLVVVLLVVISTAEAAGPPPLQVSFRDLVTHPRKYNGKRISLRAYVVTSCVHCGEFWESVRAARRFGDRSSKTEQWIAIGKLAPGLTLPKRFAQELDHQRYDGYVHVTGIFQYWPTKPLRERIRPSPDKGRVVVEGSIHFGWGGIDDMQITDITELRPLGPPIRAREEWFMPRDASNHSMQPTAGRRTASVHFMKTSLVFFSRAFASRG
jgi:hypothetical protein